jgi:hypothetical protein
MTPKRSDILVLHKWCIMTKYESLTLAPKKYDKIVKELATLPYNCAWCGLYIYTLCNSKCPLMKLYDCCMWPDSTYNCRTSPRQMLDRCIVAMRNARRNPTYIKTVLDEYGLKEEL